MVDRLIAAVASGKDRRPLLVVLAEDVASLHVFGNLDSGECERKGRDVDVLHEVVANLPGLDGRSGDDQRHVQAFIVEKLLPPGMADSVVGHEENDRVLMVALVFEPCNDVADELVCEPNRVEVGRPIRQQDRIVRIVGRKLHHGRIGPAPQQLLDASADPPERLE